MKKSIVTQQLISKILLFSLEVVGAEQLTREIPDSVPSGVEFTATENETDPDSMTAGKDLVAMIQ